MFVGHMCAEDCLIWCLIRIIPIWEYFVSSLGYLFMACRFPPLVEQRFKAKVKGSCYIHILNCKEDGTQRAPKGLKLTTLCFKIIHLTTVLWCGIVFTINHT